MSIDPIKKDGRSLRAEKTYDEAHQKLINSAESFLTTHSFHMKKLPFHKLLNMQEFL